MPESPWQQAGQSVQGMGDTMNQVGFAIQRLRQAQQYRAAQQQIALARLMMQQQADQPRIAIDQAKLQSADQGADAMRMLMPRPDPMQGPTAAGAQQLSMADLAAAAARAQLLMGRNPIALHNVGANQVAMNQFGVQGRGPTVANPDQTVIPQPGEQPVYGLPRAFSIPAGGTPALSQGIGATGPQTAFRPQASGTRMGQAIPILLKGLLDQDIYNPAGRTNAPAGMADLYRAATNAAAMVGQDLKAAPPVNFGGGQQPPVVQTQQGDSMVEVTNPSGKRVRIRSAQLAEALQQGYTQ